MEVEKIDRRERAVFFQGKPGEAFRDGKLYRFSRTQVEVLRGGEQPQAWKKTAVTRQWRGCRPIISLRPFQSNEKLQKVLAHCPEKPGSDNRKHNRRQRARAEWLLTIPEEIRRSTAIFPFRHWQMLAFLSRCGGPAADLTAGNPALAFMLANHLLFHQPAVSRPWRAARALLAKKRPQILAWLGFPGTRQVEKIIAKIKADAIIDDAWLLGLRPLLAEPKVRKRLSHLPFINRDVLYLTSKPAIFGLVGDGFLHELLESNNDLYHLTQLEDTINMARLLETGDGRLLIPSLAALENQHTRLLESMLTRHSEETVANLLPTDNFPAPPLPGLAGVIEPITNTAALKRLGLQQRNCVASWQQAIVENKTRYVYRIIKPEKATIGLRKSATGWFLQEVRGPNNRPVNEETMAVVENWLAAHAELIHTNHGRLGNNELLLGNNELEDIFF